MQDSGLCFASVESVMKELTLLLILVLDEYARWALAPSAGVSILDRIGWVCVPCILALARACAISLASRSLTRACPIDPQH